ncbi:MAG: sigma-54-dependent Fis family transcriptional regulator [Saprospiraceae bacterium]|nr:sigma-54-dependent Fis family transcriptional regulator [Saprospiraceae bacterium]
METILIIDDDIAIGASLRLLFKKKGYRGVCCSEPREAITYIEREHPKLILLDMNFTVETSGKEGLKLLNQIRGFRPELPIILITGWGTIQLAIEGMKAGASDFLTKPWDNDHLWSSVETALQITGNNSPPRSTQKNDLIVGKDPVLLDILDMISRVSQTDASVLITGESGTGKELIAETIHQNSLRHQEPFVKVNLGGISSTLFESEMFGHTRGAFTDARSDRTGRFEMADGGTIFLDEIGELEMASQVKLLRVLQDKTYEVLGSSIPRKTNVRVISATNRSLPDMVSEGTFREDLFYRINLITIRLPSLRERPGDIPLLVRHFLSNLKEIYNRPDLTISDTALQWLQQLTFPGNIRQLKNLIERSVLMSVNNQLEIEDFSAHFNSRAQASELIYKPGLMTLEEMEINMINQAMQFHKNNISQAARSLGITRHALYRRIEKYNLQYDASN